MAVILLLYGMPASATSCDTTFIFSYDNSGNRIERIIDLSKSAQIQNGSLYSEEKKIMDELGGHEIKIYPNPTKGALKIEIPGLEGTNARLVVFNNQGKQVIDKKTSGMVTHLNLSRYPSGMYILKILVGREASEWKILKD